MYFHLLNQQLDPNLKSLVLHQKVEENEKLPEDVLNIIFIHAKALAPACDVLVNRHWYVKNLGKTKNNIYDSLNNFLIFLTCHIKESYSTRIKEEVQLKSLSSIPTATDFMQLQALLLSSREAVLNILKDLEVDELEELKNRLKDENKFNFFENLFDLVDIYKDIDSLLGEDEGKNSMRFSWIIQSLNDNWTSHKLNKLLDVTQHVTTELKLLAFKSMASELKTDTLRNKALNIIAEMEDQVQQKEALELITPVTHQEGDLD